MRVFVYEHTCARPDGTPASLRTEGSAMLPAVLEDFTKVPQIELATILAPSVSLPTLHSTSHIKFEHHPAAFHDLARACDYALVIAPELDGILLQLASQVEEAGGRLLGPSPAAIELTTDKLVLCQYLRDRGVTTPECLAYGSRADVPEHWFPVVLKPRDGAGSTATFFAANAERLSQCAEGARNKEWQGEFIVQRFVRGQAASAAVIVGDAQRILLPPARQELTRDGRFRYQGGTIPLRGALARRATRLAAQAVNAVPGLRGYVGVDLVLGDAEDGSGDWVIEINPRLTTSYVGLRALARDNLAAAMLDVARGEVVSPIAWRDGPVRFHADGRVNPGASEGT